MVSVACRFAVCAAAVATQVMLRFCVVVFPAVKVNVPPVTVNTLAFVPLTLKSPRVVVPPLAPPVGVTPICPFPVEPIVR